jgi:type I restriction enzyme S subunit
MNADRLLDAFNRLGDEPDTVQQFRKLVVGLAMSGKLVAPDEAALAPSNLLKQIEAKKRALVQQGVLRKQNPFSAVSLEDLPRGFTNASNFVRLGEIARIEKGQTGIMKAEPGAYPLVVTAEERGTCDHFDFDGSAAIVPLVSSAGHGKASLQRLHYQEGKFALGSILAAIFPHAPELISARFLFEYLTSFKDELLVSQMIGTANVSLSVGKVSDVPVPLVPPLVQRKVDELMGLCDRLEAARAGREAVRDRLAAASLARLSAPDPETFQADARFALDALPALTTRPDQIKRLRQTILNLAVRGKLVPQDPNDEPAAELLKRIAKEKARAGKREKVEADIDNEEELGDLPPTWRAVPLIALGSWAIGSGFPKNEQGLESGPHFFLKVSDMNLPGNEKYITTSNNFIDDDAARRMRAKIHPPGTIIFPKIGGAIATNKRRILNRGSAIDNNCLGITFSSALNVEWAFLLLTTLDFTRYQAGTAVPALQQGVLERIPVGLPPLSEQHRIVAKVDALMALCDRLEASLTATTATRRRLLDALLAEALAPVDAREMEVAE